MRLTRHDYDLLMSVHQNGGSVRISDSRCAEKLKSAQLLDIHPSGRMTLTDYGRRQLQRVRGVGQGLFKVPPGYVLVPRQITPEMLEAARAYGPTFTAASYRDMLSRAPKVTP